MTPPPRYLKVLALALVAVLAASCGSSTTKPKSDPPPAVTTPELVEAIDFGSTDANALAAQALVSTQLITARTSTLLGSAILGPAAAADWVAQEACWTWSYPVGGCTVDYDVCVVTGGYEWTVVIDGECAGQTIQDWALMDGESTADGLSGTLNFYRKDSGIVNAAVVWDNGADGNSGTWSFYNGTVDPFHLAGTMEWVQTSGTVGQVTWVIPDEIKWVLTTSADGNAGTMSFYDWVDGDWKLTTDIVWNSDGTGSWTTYDDIGGDTVKTW
jgi:hypothetical protein